MNKNIKKLASVVTVASLSLTTVVASNELLSSVNAQETANTKEESKQETTNVSADVFENEAGAVIRVTANADVKNVKTNYAVDSGQNRFILLGDLKSGEVREIQVSLDGDYNYKVLPKTSVVTDKVDFSSEIRGHKIKGSVTFEVEDSKVCVSKKETPKEETLKVEEPKVETPKEETPKVETPKVETPKVETPKEETPKVETPKEETPKVETPKEETPKEETPKVNPVDAGMPTNAKWTRSQLQEWGYGMGTITGNYAVDGDLGLFNSHQAMENGYNKGSNNLDDQLLNGTMSGAQYDKTPHGYFWSKITHNGQDGYKVSLYDKDGKYNAPETPKVETPKEETPKEETPKVETPKEETPKVETPKEETPKVETPKEETPKVETPKVETPKEETPKVETPKEETPKEETPKVETPKEETPKVETPKEETPKVETPKEETPKVETPKEETPKVETPKEETPKVETPKEETPKVETPKEETPKVETPKEETPKVETPKEETPKEETPKVETPKVETPKVETPTTPEVNPVDAGMPAEAKWSRSDLQNLGYGIGTVTGNYKVDGDLGLFNSQQAMENAYNKGADNVGDLYLNDKITDAQYDNTPHGYSWTKVTYNGQDSYKVSVYDKNGKYNVPGK